MTKFKVGEVVNVSSESFGQFTKEIKAIYYTFGDDNLFKEDELWPIGNVDPKMKRKAIRKALRELAAEVAEIKSGEKGVWCSVNYLAEQLDNLADEI